MIKIGSREISNQRPTFIIAEAGVNHNGKLALAKKLVDAAKAAGADAVKFQTFKTKNLVTAKAALADYQRKNTGRSQSQLSLLKKLELSYQDFKILKKYCDAKKIIFLSTPHTVEAAHDLKGLCPAYKVASGDITNNYLLKNLAQQHKSIILSTGMATLAEVKTAVAVIEKNGNKKIIILHCTSSYPCPLPEVNLRAMLTLKQNLPYLVGYSDHTLGQQAAVMAVTLGAVMIEKHLTLDKKLPGPDHAASLSPKEFTELVAAIRNVPVILGSQIKKPTAAELKTAKVARKSIVATQAIKRGETFSFKNVGIKRPGTGLSPVYYEKIIGRQSKRHIKIDSLIKKSDYES